jgi:hypothetical protein
MFGACPSGAGQASEARCPGLIRFCLLCQLFEPLQTGFSTLTLASIFPLAPPGRSEFLNQARFFVLSEGAGDLAHHLTAGIFRVGEVIAIGRQ